MRFLKIAFGVVTYLSIAACAGMMPSAPATSTDETVDGSMIIQSAAPADLFIALEPYSFEDFFEVTEYEDVDGDDLITAIDILTAFPNEAVQVRVQQFTASGEATFPVVGVSTAHGNYEVTVDYAKYRTDYTTDNFVYQSGFGIRLRANIVTSEAGVNISSLFGIAAAAQQKKLAGSLRFETIGISGKLTSSLIPLPSEISFDSISAALQAAAAIKSNLYDVDQVRIVPQVFAFKEITVDAKNDKITKDTKEKDPNTLTDTE